MEFNSLEEKCLFYRSLTNYRLTGDSEYVIIMLDGRSFSKMVKKHFELPFDKNFSSVMDNTAKYLCQNIQGSKIAFVQSDEISIYVHNIGNNLFNNRLCKIQSLIAAMASSYFNREMLLNAITIDKPENIKEFIKDSPIYQFDCRAWSVPNMNDAMAWFLYRQIDCIKNSKQQAAQTYIPHKKLMNHTTDEQVIMLKDIADVDWNNYWEGFKYGRLIYNKEVSLENPMYGQYIRHLWDIIPAKPLTQEENREEFKILMNK